MLVTWLSCWLKMVTAYVFWWHRDFGELKSILDIGDKNKMSAASFICWCMTLMKPEWPNLSRLCRQHLRLVTNIFRLQHPSPILMVPHHQLPYHMIHIIWNDSYGMISYGPYGMIFVLELIYKRSLEISLLWWVQLNTYSKLISNLWFCSDEVIWRRLCCELGI